MYINGSETPSGELAYDPANLIGGENIMFCSRESQYCGSVSASFSGLSVADLSPEPVETVVEIDTPRTLATVVAPTTDDVVFTAEDLPVVTITNAETGTVVAEDVVLTGNEDTDLTQLKSNKKDKNDSKRKAYGIFIARHNRLNNLHCSVTEKLPAGIYVFSFQSKVGAKNLKFSANITDVK